MFTKTVFSVDKVGFNHQLSAAAYMDLTPCHLAFFLLLKCIHRVVHSKNPLGAQVAILLTFVTNDYPKHIISKTVKPELMTTQQVQPPF